MNLSDGSSDHGQRLTLFSFVCALNSCIILSIHPLNPRPLPLSPSPTRIKESVPSQPQPTPVSPRIFTIFTIFTILGPSRRPSDSRQQYTKEGNTVLHGVKNDSKVWSPCSWWTRWLRQTLRSRRTSPCMEGLKRTRWNYVVGVSL